MSLRANIASVLMGLSLLLAPLWALAQDGYTVEVAVADRSPAEQDAAYRIAMRRVLLDNAGDKTLLSRTDVRNALARAKNYVVQFSYRAPAAGEVISATTPVTDRVQNTGEATQIIKVRFDRDRISQVIEGQAQSTATEVSPAVSFRSALAWLVIRDGGNDLLIGGSSGGKVMQRAREIAGGSGIVLLFPAADTADINSLGGSEQLSVEQDVVLNASLRYTTPAIVSADIRRLQPVGWQGNWLRIAGDQLISETFEASTLDELLQMGLTWMAPSRTTSSVAASSLGGSSVANSAANTAATTSFSPAPLASESTIYFSGVESITDYAALLELVRGIEGTRSVYTKEVRDRGIVIAVQPRSALAQVRARLAQVSGLTETARPVFPDGSTPAVDVAFDYFR